MFTSKKTAESLTASIKQHEDEIAALQKENENLKQVSERAARINEKLSSIFE